MKVLRQCRECGEEFNWKEKIKRYGGYSNVCSDCHLSGPDPDANTPTLRAVTTGDGKMAAMTILKFDSSEDADMYVRAHNANTGWNNRRSGGINDIKHTLVGENFGNVNHKGRS